MYAYVRSRFVSSCSRSSSRFWLSTRSSRSCDIISISSMIVIIIIIMSSSSTTTASTSSSSSSSIYIYTYIEREMYVCMYVCIFVCLYVCMFVCLYVCMYVYIYIYIYNRRAGAAPLTADHVLRRLHKVASFILRNSGSNCPECFLYA